MTTNREWLYSLDVADLADWFDAEHVDGMSLKPVRNPDTYAGKEDSRERLENDIAWEYAQVGFGPNMDEVIGWLDRQAAITANELVSLSVDEDSPVKGESDTAESRIRNFDADSRKKLEADVREYYRIGLPGIQETELHRLYYEQVLEWLDRQAAITEREVGDTLLRQDERIAELTAELEREKKHREYAYNEVNRFIKANGELTKRNNQLREHLSAALDNAHSTIALIDLDEGLA